MTLEITTFINKLQKRSRSQFPFQLYDMSIYFMIDAQVTV